MRVLAALTALLFMVASATADDTRLVDADTIVLSGTKFRLDGVDAPETAQKCLTTVGTVWRCGEAATDALAKFIAGSTVVCQDVGEDTKYHRRLGHCFADGVSIEHWLVREGWAIEFKKHSNGRFAAEELGPRRIDAGSGQAASPTLATSGIRTRVARS
jgi:endonuclease YncB( thermonuclease family)